MPFFTSSLSATYVPEKATRTHTHTMMTKFYRDERTHARVAKFIRHVYKSAKGGSQCTTLWMVGLCTILHVCVCVWKFRTWASCVMCVNLCECTFICVVVVAFLYLYWWRRRICVVVLVVVTHMRWGLLSSSSSSLKEISYSSFLYLYKHGGCVN